ncbi:MAG: DUF3604 domain-containing protein [Candidatus Brocadiia bacterium]
MASDEPTGILCTIPSRVGVGEEFPLKIKVLGPVHPIKSSGGWRDWKPGLRGPFNLNVQRNIQYMDNCFPEWQGTLEIDGEEGLEGPEQIVFDGTNQGVFKNDSRPIKVVKGFKWTTPGFHFVILTDPESGLCVSTNPVFVTEAPPEWRIYWGDPHWQTFFSDGIRCPEELYCFARDEAFLDFGAIADHMEAVTDRQWDYFKAVTNDYNQPGRFATLVGQEWTNHDPDHGAPGHRNIYYPGDSGPVLRSTDPKCNTLEKLWNCLEDIGEALAIPHHSANKVMGVDWDLGWNPKFEKAVEVYSVWGNSEKPARNGNPRPMSPENLGGEVDGRHVVDALKRGYRLGFVGGGDIHDGRPGDALHDESYPDRGYRIYDQGFTACVCPALNRQNIYDSIKRHSTYATTKSRIYLDVESNNGHGGLSVRAASEEGIAGVTLVLKGAEPETVEPDNDPRIVEANLHPGELGQDEFCYVRVLTEQGNMAWSSPLWGD